MSTAVVDRPRPRVETHPPYVEHHGDIAAQLMRAAGQPLDGWQEDGVALMLARRDDGQWACFEYCEMVPRQNGKGALLEARVLMGMFYLGEQLIIWSAHQYKTAMEGFRRVLTLVGRLGEKLNENLYDLGENADGARILVKVWNTHGEEGFERLDTGQRIKFVARSKSSARGFSGDVVIIDEAFAYTSEQHAALMPTLSARPNPQIIYTSTPPLDGESGEVLYELRARGEEMDTQDDSLGWRNWGAPGELEKLGDLDEWDPNLHRATNPALGTGAGCRISPETPPRERRSLGRIKFCQERLGIWPRNLTASGGVIETRAWADLADPESRRDGMVALALDVTPLQDRACISMYGTREDGLGHLQVVAYGEGTEWVVPKLLSLREALNPVAIAIDARSGAGAFLDELRELGLTVPDDPEHPSHGDLAIPSSTEVGQATGQFLKAVRRRGLRHIGQEELLTAVGNGKTQPLGDGIKWARKQSEVDISPLVSATLARWAFETRRHLKPKTIELTGSLMA